MIDVHHDELRLLLFEGLSQQAGVAHAVTTRPQNFAPHRGVGREHAIQWRRMVCAWLGAPFERLTSPEQVMGADVVCVEPGDIGAGRDGRGSAVRFVDGLITDEPNLPLVLLSADCPILCAYDARRPAVGAVHAGWQGTLAGAAQNLVRQMQRTFDSDPSQIRAAVAPSAGPDAYQVGQIVHRIARSRWEQADDWIRERAGRLTLDLWAANREQLVDAGVPPDRIEVAGLCTMTDQRFWSHRRDGADAGRFAVFLMLRG